MMRRFVVLFGLGMAGLAACTGSPGTEQGGSGGGNGSGSGGHGQSSGSGGSGQGSGSGGN